MTIQMKAVELYFHVLFTMLCLFSQLETAYITRENEVDHGLLYISNVYRLDRKTVC